MASDRTERRLAAIMFTDIVGYAALMAESEAKGLRVRERHRALVRPLVEAYRGESTTTCSAAWACRRSRPGRSPSYLPPGFSRVRPLRGVSGSWNFRW